MCHRIICNQDVNQTGISLKSKFCQFASVNIYVSTFGHHNVMELVEMRYYTEIEKDKQVLECHINFVYCSKVNLGSKMIYFVFSYKL